MAWIRTIVAFAAVIPAGFLTFLAWTLDGYVEDYGMEPANTIPFAIPWTLATLALVALALIAATLPARRERFSWFACYACFLLVVIFGVFSLIAGL